MTTSRPASPAPCTSPPPIQGRSFRRTRPSQRRPAGRAPSSRCARQQSLAAADTLTPSIATSIPAVTQVVHGPAASLVVTGIPASTVAGTSLTAIVTAVDKHGNVVTDFASTVHLASTDPKAALPPDFTFTAADLGTHPFPIVLVSAATSRVMIVSSAGLPMVTANVPLGDAGAGPV